MKLIELSKQGSNKGKYFAKVDDSDYEWLNKYRWCSSRIGHTRYAHGVVNGRRVIMHRFILGITDPNIDGDRRDRDGLNNQRSNLRIATRSQNATNKRKRKNSTSSFNGVNYSSERKKWCASITHKYKMIALGRFESEMEAAKAYDKKAKELFGDFANLNFK